MSGPARGAGRLEVRGDISSQFLTALMLIGPYVPGGLRICHHDPARVASVRADHQIGDGRLRPRRCLDRRAAPSRLAPGRIKHAHYAIEPDASSASYPLTAAAICGGRVEIPGLTKWALQGDAVFCDVLAAMGCVATRDTKSTIVKSGDRLEGVDIDMVEMSDLVPTLAAAAVFAKSPTRIRGVGFIRAKESDRLGDLCAELRRLGANAEETDDGLMVEPSTLHGSRLQTHHDHRLAMAFGLVGLRVADVEIDDPDVVSKSWPGYWAMLGGLR